MEASATAKEKKKKTCQNQEKSDHGTSLSKEQYDLIYSFLKTGKKPDIQQLKSACLNGNKSNALQHPKMSSCFRFKSVASRLKIKEDGKELVFKANNKIVLPINRFEEVITKVHQNDGKKHLNITRTLEKVRLHKFINAYDIFFLNIK